MRFCQILPPISLMLLTVLFAIAVAMGDIETRVRSGCPLAGSLGALPFGALFGLGPFSRKRFKWRNNPNKRRRVPLFPNIDTVEG